MIPRANITAWRTHAPWASDAQVERDLVITRALVEIYRDPHLGAALAYPRGHFPSDDAAFNLTFR
jgi:hypothetical protein